MHVPQRGAIDSPFVRRRPEAGRQEHAAHPSHDSRYSAPWAEGASVSSGLAAVADSHGVASDQAGIAMRDRSFLVRLTRVAHQWIRYYSRSAGVIRTGAPTA